MECHDPSLRAVAGRTRNSTPKSLPAGGAELGEQRLVGISLCRSSDIGPPHSGLDLEHIINLKKPPDATDWKEPPKFGTQQSPGAG